MKSVAAIHPPIHPLVLLLPLSLGACSVATAAIKAQIANQCGSVGVKGCPEIAEGAIAYVQGDEAEAEAKLRSAAAQNSPEQVRQLTKALKPVLEAADPDTARKLRVVVAILEGDEGRPTDTARPDSPVAKAAPPKERSKSERTPPRVVVTPTKVEMDSLRAGMVNPAAESQLLPCDPGTIDARTCGRVRVLLGPFILTNLYTSGGCSEELFVSSADPKGQWTMLVLPGEKLNVAGRFPIEEGQPLYAGTRGSAAQKSDPRCAIVWAGFRPAEKDVTPTSPREFGY